jgi:tetratricopeptide (TPR) repeat protein
MTRRLIYSHSVEIFICLGLVLLVVVPFQQTVGFGFVSYDDVIYIIGNKNLEKGFVWSSVSWAFTNLFAMNWHPLTWLSLMLDFKLYGTNAGGYHLTNVLLHLANTLLLFYILRRMTGKSWQSGFVAALFAVHPLHVESVAWVMARKDVLSTMFWLLTIGAYAEYVKYPSPRRYLWVAGAFILGLMSKPMLVTLPVVLLLLDFWPLRRIQSSTIRGNLHLLLEKVPLMVLSVAVSVITFYAQGNSGAMEPLNLKSITLMDRILNAVVSYGGYVGNMLQPVNLACFYPYRTSFPMSIVLPSVLFLVAMFILSLRYIRTAPYLVMGWLWYLITLLPVIGIIQVGGQAMADRYTYIPLIGLFIIIAWGIPDLLKENPFHRIIISVAAGATLLIFTILTYNQAGVWKDSRTLFEHALEVTDGNFVAHNNLGSYFFSRDRFDEAADQFSKAVKIIPDAEYYQNNLGSALAKLKRYDEAISCFSRAIEINHRFAKPYTNIAYIHFLAGHYEKALEYYRKALELQSGDPVAENNVALMLIYLGKDDEAIVYLKSAIRHKPDFATARNMLAVLLVKKNRIQEAIDQLNEALRINPQYAEARKNLQFLKSLSHPGKDGSLKEAHTGGQALPKP